MKDKYIKYFSVLSLFFWQSCSLSKYGGGVIEDAKNNFKIHKDFFYSINFYGMITNKEILDKIENGSPQLSIKITYIEKKIPLGNVQYSPYYMFDNQDGANLKMIVSSKIFSYVSIGDTLFKEKNSDSVLINKQKFLLLNKIQDKWSP